MASGLRLAFFLCLTAVLISETWCIKRACPRGWSSYGRRCFIVFSRKRTAANAELSCVRYGGNLASIHNYRQNNFIRRLVYLRFRSYRRIWIGLHDAMQEKRWMWTDGSRVRYTRWRRGQPNNRRNEDCTEMNFKGNFWNDARCRRRRPYVCARKRGPVRPIIRPFPRPRPIRPRPIRPRPIRPRPIRPRPIRPRPIRPRPIRPRPIRPRPIRPRPIRPRPIRPRPIRPRPIRPRPIRPRPIRPRPIRPRPIRPRPIRPRPIRPRPIRPRPIRPRPIRPRPIRPKRPKRPRFPHRG